MDVCRDLQLSLNVFTSSGPIYGGSPRPAAKQGGLYPGLNYHSIRLGDVAGGTYIMRVKGEGRVESGQDEGSKCNNYNIRGGDITTPNIPKQAGLFLGNWRWRTGSFLRIVCDWNDRCDLPISMCLITLLQIDQLETWFCILMVVHMTLPIIPNGDSINYGARELPTVGPQGEWMEYSFSLMILKARFIFCTINSNTFQYLASQWHTPSSLLQG